MWFNRAALKAEARACMRQSRANPYVTALVYIVISFLITYLSGRLISEPLVRYHIDAENFHLSWEVSPYFFQQFYYRPFSGIINFLLRLVDLMIGAGFTIFALNMARRVETSTGNLFDSFAHFLRIFGLYFMQGVFTFLWSLLFVIPGIIAAYRYRLAIYLLLEHPELGVMDCIRESKRLMRGRKGELFVLDLSFFGWALLAAIPYVGLLVSVYTTPYMETTYAGYYLAVIGHEGYRAPGPDRQEDRDPWD